MVLNISVLQINCWDLGVGLRSDEILLYAHKKTFGSEILHNDFLV